MCQSFEKTTRVDENFCAPPRAVTNVSIPQLCMHLHGDQNGKGLGDTPKISPAKLKLNGIASRGTKAHQEIEGRESHHSEDDSGKAEERDSLEYANTRSGTWSVAVDGAARMESEWVEAASCQDVQGQQRPSL